jgi:hypothetical protein
VDIPVFGICRHKAFENNIDVPASFSMIDTSKIRSGFPSEKPALAQGECDNVCS